MEVIISKNDTDKNDLSSKVEVLNHLEEKVKDKCSSSLDENIFVLMAR